MGPTRIRLRPRTWVRALVIPVCSALLLLCGAAGAVGQAPDVPVDEEAIRALAEPEPVPVSPSRETGIDFFSLVTKGGWLMVPIGVMSLVVVTLTVERLIGLSRRRVIPRGFVRRLNELADPPERFDPEAAYRLCHPPRNAAQRVVGALLSRTGRPVGEIEATGREAAQREADALSGPIRSLHLAAAVAPLMGLLGTVWGMVRAFHDLSQLPAGENKAEFLAEGIYVALITTVAGLAVAIPAAICAHYFEGRLVNLLRQVEELTFRLAPCLDRFVSRQRLDMHGRLRPLKRPSRRSARGAGVADAGAAESVEARTA